MIFPLTPEDSWARYPHRHIHAQVARAAEAAGLEVLDLLELFTRHDPASMRIHDPHPSAKAHRLAAEAIANQLAE